MRFNAMACFLACVLVLGALDASVGLDAGGWGLGLACSTALVVALAGGMRRHEVHRLGPADRVTLARAALACAVAGLVADAGGHTGVPALVGLGAVALLLDWVDGRVARRTGTVSAFGAEFDMEVDAFLVLVLSAHVAPSAGAFVLLAGAARYVLLLGTRLLPWLRRPTPPRYWGKVVAATQGVVLVVAAADVVPWPVMDAALLGALALLAESFGRQVWWLWSHRAPATPSLLPEPDMAT